MCLNLFFGQQVVKKSKRKLFFGRSKLLYGNIWKDESQSEREESFFFFVLFFSFKRHDMACKKEKRLGET